jgi:signal transduction histidine kinase
MMPSTTPTPRDGRSEGKPERHPDRERALVLNVNDREAARYLIGRMLRIGGFEVVDAVTGEEALELAGRLRPQVMVLDIQLPGIDGLEVCRRLKANPETAGIAVLQTSATFVGPEAKVRGLDVGADGFIMQPFTSQELIATVNSLVRLKQRESTQQDRADALELADRRKDDFMAMLAHELRNPVAAITSALELLEEQPARDDNELRAREVARRQTRVLGRLVDDLLDMSRVSRGLIVLKRETLDLVPVLRQTVANVQAAAIAQRRQHLTVELPERMVCVDGDATRLQQVFANLIDNASKYTDAGGHIQVSLGEEQGDDGQAWAVVRVVDDGIGIPAAALADLFRLFYQAHASLARSSGGLGIGLTLVRTLTELHGGKVNVHSDGPDKGSQFTVRLPIVQTEGVPLGMTPPVGLRRWVDGVSPPPPPDKDGIAARRDDAPGKDGVAAPARRKRVLVVEDNDDNREMLMALCQMWGHDVIGAADGLEGVRLAVEERPDVAFVDLGLPGIDGFEVARRVRQTIGPGIRLVALSGYGASSEHDSAFDLHVVKPADPGRLEAILSE